MENVSRNEFDLRLLTRLYKLEDRLARQFRKYPLDRRIDSAPFLASDTYYYLSDIRIEDLNSVMQLESAAEISIIYLNGNSLQYIFPTLIEELRTLKRKFNKLIIGDSDFSPKTAQLLDLSDFFHSIYSVNLKTSPRNTIHNLPLGLESRRYRSAGQIRDFQKLPRFNCEEREIDILVAWNDATNQAERVSARRTLTKNKLVMEIKERVPARLVHKLMRDSKLIPCPRGNGLDTHRFWESLYLGALPIILCKNELTKLNSWPYVCVESWEELVSWDKTFITNVYMSKKEELFDFRNSATQFLKRLQALECET